ncbi:hypothetical protein DB35_04925 [Streptomyces abyssalis]|jgi:hypothetical protein|uniref:Uncharacterized protein n=2 Tax=Streptomyces TaxID=1883 RepID=A0A1E7JQH1_9ACTN|nr:MULTISPECIES: hypothetical protein [Streptomyces]OEU90529.1 hypothetical protein AN215_14000 [Streptomyces abyssalis]OEU95268.1 hypothetical protein DB35_04925 [Streptomyces abyssalis]QPP07288.1 hypothetical protein G4Z16_13845 [Streptomyces bathyalis]
MSRRQKARRQREAAHFAAKRAAAPTSAALAAVAFDELRARLADLPAQERERAWQQVADDLDAWARHFDRTHAA